jgi:hypothetical protein
VLRDLTDAPAHTVDAERARVATEGWGASLLALQAPDGRWAEAAWNRGWNSTMHVLALLVHLGLDPGSVQARSALDRVREHVTWRGCGPPACDANRFFDGEQEPCINAQVAAVGAYFGEDVGALVERLIDQQLADGGWNCDAPRASRRASFNTTVCVLEALLGYEQANTADAAVTAARVRGTEYLLERRLYRRLSTGEPIERDRKGGGRWTELAFPTWWHYDLLRGLDCLRLAGVEADARVAEALDIVASKAIEGRWPLDVSHPGTMPVDLGEHEHGPSRWNTLRALRVLDWGGRRDHTRDA